MDYWIKHILPLSYTDESVNHPNRLDCCIPPESHQVVFMFEKRLFYDIANMRCAVKKKRDKVGELQRMRCGYIAKVCNYQRLYIRRLQECKINRSHITDPSSKERLGVRSAVKRIFAWGKREDGFGSRGDHPIRKKFVHIFPFSMILIFLDTWSVLQLTSYLQVCGLFINKAMQWFIRRNSTGKHN